MKTRSTELSVGILGIVGILAIGGFMLQFGKLDGRLKGTYQLMVEISDANGIRKGVPVRLGGLSVGYVSDTPKLKDDYSALELPLAIFEDIKIPKDSVITIGTTGLMGDSFVKIVLPTEITGEFIEPDSSLPMGDSDGLVALQSNVESLLTGMGVTMTEINRTIKNLDRTFEKIDYLTSADNLQSFNEMMDNLAESSAKINKASEGLDPLMTTVTDSLNEIRKTSLNLQELSTKIDPLLGSADTSLVEIRKTAVNLREVSTKLDPLTTSAQSTLAEVESAARVARQTIENTDVDLDKGINALDDLASAAKKIDPTIDQFETTLLRFQGTLANADAFTGRLEQGDGLLKELRDNEELRDDFISLLDKIEKKGFVFYPRERDCPPPTRKFVSPKMSAH
ncbi:MAG: MlaD family protein [Verrucomicrobiales bacterium]|nr:MlaD family protein [Verrucomicrobiales bacterium]